MSLSQFFTFLLVGIGLSFDTFAVSVSFGILKREIRFLPATRIALVMAFSQAASPVLGWLIGTGLKELISRFDHWVAFGLLALVGIRMIYEGVRNENGRIIDPMKPVILISVAVATSIDAMVVGLSFGFLGTNILPPALIIGAVTFLSAMLGMLFGKNIPGQTSHRSMVAGGIILILIGVKILVEHLHP